MIAALVDTEALLKVILGSVIAGLSVTIAFALLIRGAASSNEMRAAGRAAAAAAYGALGALGFAGFVAAIAYALVIITSK
jgi:hypothetical protein